MVADLEQWAYPMLGTAILGFGLSTLNIHYSLFIINYSFFPVSMGTKEKFAKASSE
jgi:hypothetical protein